MKLLVLFSLLGLLMVGKAAAHSGGTDSQGGHNDRRNGGYHFHHGMGPHQHPGGVCPYSGGGTRMGSPDNRNWFERHPVLTFCGGAGIAGWAWSNYRTKK